MCGRFTQGQEMAVLEKRFELEPGGLELKPRYNLAPGQETGVVAQGRGRRLELMRWGLVPHWAQDVAVGYKNINARAESAAEKPMFKGLLRQSRCLILADGFFEWPSQGKGQTKAPMRFLLADEVPFAFAGLWDTWTDPEGASLHTFTIITTQANDLIRPLHQRMPVILKPEDEGAWLDPELTDPGRLTSLLRPYPAGLMKGYGVSPLVNSVKNDSPQMIEPWEPPPGLFDHLG
ncbi:MAG: SOS response-associated peptidase [Desulfarculaceae bacterium]|jgi:putative SOS response-associated peptidase YedK